MKAGRLALATAWVAIAALLVASCYTIQAPTQKKKKKKQADASAAVSTELHSMIVEFVEEAMYTYPHVATRVGMHVYALSSGETVDLDRELPNYSDAVVDARIETLESYLDRLKKKVPKDAVSLNDAVDRRLLKDAIELELYQLSVRKAHTRNPVVHVAALSEAIYYPLVVEYAPETERLGDILGRMHWIPSYVDRAIRMVEHSSEVYTGVAAEINGYTIELVRDVVSDRVDAADDEQLEQAFAGMKPPVLESLEKLQDFLEKDLPKKSKLTWRLGEEQYARRFSLAFHGLSSPGKAASGARKRISDLRREMFAVAKPVYCEHNEKDTEICGPSKADIAAAKAAEQERLRKEEAAEQKAEEEEARKKAEEEKRKRREEEKEKAKEEKEKAKEEREKAKEEKKKAKEEKEKTKEEKKKDKGDKDIFNPYGGKKKKDKEEKTDGPANPYGFLLLPPAEVAGAKQAGEGKQKGKQKGKDAKKGKGKQKGKDAKKGKGAKGTTAEASDLDNVGGVDPKDATAPMIDMVLSWALEFAANEAGVGGKAVPRVEQFVPEMADLARRIEILSSVKSSGIQVEQMPTCLAALGHAVEFVPQPVFQPELNAHIFVAPNGGTDPSSWDDVRLSLATAVSAVPGQFEVYRRAGDLEMQTRRAVRAIYADQAFVRGWALYAASEIAAEDDSWIMQLTGLAQLLTAAVELVVDIELHTGSMSAKKAADMLVDRALMSRPEAETRARLSQLSPTLLSASFLGYQAWIEVRAGVKKELKKGYSRKGFHEAALDLGPVPMGRLGEMLSAENADAAPEYEAEVAEEEEKTTFSFIDAF